MDQGSDVAKRSRFAERDEAWLNLIRCGDHHALHLLFNAYYAELVAYGRRHLRIENEAPDVVQDVFASLWNRRGLIDIHSSVTAYLYGAVRLKCRDVRVHQIMVEKYMVEADDPSNENTVPNAATVSNEGEANLVIDETIRLFDAVVRQLPNRTQEVYRLCRYHMLSHREIAEALGLSINTINVQMSRAMRVIVDALSVSAA